jgi:hypothetical protein
MAPHSWQRRKPSREITVYLTCSPTHKMATEYSSESLVPTHESVRCHNREGNHKYFYFFQIFANVAVSEEEKLIDNGRCSKKKLQKICFY